MKSQSAQVAHFAAVLIMAAGGTAAWSQNTPSSASAPSVSESLPERRPAVRTRPTNAQQSMEATAGLPEGKITPQIRIPLGAKPTPQTLDLPVRKSGAAAPNPTGGAAAARCESQRGEQVRAKCRDRLARESK